MNRLDHGAFVEVDHVKNADSIGMRAWFANDEAAIRQALSETRGEQRSCMIVVRAEKYRYTPDAGVWWEVVGTEVTNNPITAQLVAEHEAGRATQRFYY